MILAKRMLALGALLCASTAYAGTPGWTVSESSGSVIVSRPGFSAAAIRGGAVSAGDVISTGKNGRAVLVRGEEYLVVSPGARITIADPKPGAMTQIIQSFGNALYKIKKMATPHFAVETPYLAAVVKGTTFSVTVTPKGASVQVTEGRVEVATPDGGASYLVTPGEIGIVSRDAPYSLKVEGKEVRTIESPNRPAAPAPADIEVQATETASALDASIEGAIGEGSVQLASLSGGMISGDSAISIATVSSRVVPVVPVASPLGAVTVVPPVSVPTVPAETAVSMPPVPVDTAVAVPPTTGTTPSAPGSGVETVQNMTPPTPVPTVPADVVAAMPPITPATVAVVPGIGVETAPGAISPPPLPIVPTEVVAAIPPVIEAVAPLIPVSANVPGVAGPIGIGVAVGSTPGGTGNSGNGEGNGGGDGSNAGGQGNGNGNGNRFGDDDDDNDGGRSRRGRDRDDDRDRGRGGRGGD